MKCKTYGKRSTCTNQQPEYREEIQFHESPHVNDALKAHEGKRVVLAEGELVREGRSFALRNARNFSVEMDE